MGGLVRFITIPTITILYLVPDMKTPHPKLVPLLLKHGIGWEAFCKRGRPPAGVRDKRVAIVTELHEGGCSWSEMYEITGLSNGSIQRLTGAKGCAAVRAKRRNLGKNVGATWAGKKRPGQLERQWASGTFNFHRGRVRSPEERARLKASWTPELRLQAKDNSKRYVWGNPKVRARLLDFHRSPEERVRCSRAQVQRMKDNPGKYLRGRAQWMDTPKGSAGRAYVRSSYEAAAVRLLESDPLVVRYEHERRMMLPDGRWVLPDFVVERADGRTSLIEVKADWVFSLPEGHKTRKRILIARDLAANQGWDFIVWTEQELKNAF